jgi:hypothetical protein
MKLEKTYNEVFHNLHSSPNIIRMIKERRVIWAGPAACMDGMHTKKI